MGLIISLKDPIQRIPSNQGMSFFFFLYLIRRDDDEGTAD